MSKILHNFALWSTPAITIHAQGLLEIVGLIIGFHFGFNHGDFWNWNESTFFLWGQTYKGWDKVIVLGLWIVVDNIIQSWKGSRTGTWANDLMSDDFRRNVYYGRGACMYLTSLDFFGGTINWLLTYSLNLSNVKFLLINTITSFVMNLINIYIAFYRKGNNRKQFEENTFDEEQPLIKSINSTAISSPTERLFKAEETIKRLEERIRILEKSINQ